MAGSVNKVILVGNLGKDPEVRRMTSGDPVVNLSVATSESWRDKASGEKQGKDRMAPGGDLQQEPGRGGREISAQGLQGLSRRASSRPANGPTRTARRNTRPKWCCRISAANLVMLDGRSGGGGRRRARARSAPARRRPASSATRWMTRFRSSFRPAFASVWRWPVAPRSSGCRRTAIRRTAASPPPICRCAAHPSGAGPRRGAAVVIAPGIAVTNAHNANLVDPGSVIGAARQSDLMFFRTGAPGRAATAAPVDRRGRHRLWPGP